MAGFLETLLDTMTMWVVEIVHALGYPGLVVLMAMESMIFPVPSEAVMAPAGILVAEGRMNLFWVMVASSLGSVVGSLLSYWAGLRMGTPLIRRYGKYFFLHEKHLDWSHQFFEKRGAIAIFISRFVPGVRHVISIPAGVARMPLTPFIVYTFLGATMWNGFLVYVGYTFGTHWEEVIHNAKYIFAAVGLLAAGYLAWWGYKRWKGTAQAAAPATAEPASVENPAGKN